MFGKLFGATKELLSPIKSAHPVNYGTELFTEFKAVQSHLKGMPGLEAILQLIKVVQQENWPRSWIEHGNLGKRIPDEETRGAVFDSLFVLSKMQIWFSSDVENTDWAKSKHFSALALFCMHLSADMIEAGFPLGGRRLEKTLQLMAANLAKLDLRAWVYGYQTHKLDIIFEMQKCVAGGIVLSPISKFAANDLLTLLTKRPQSKKAIPEVKDNSVVKALRGLAGVTKQKTYLQRMLDAGSTREHDSGISEFTPEHKQFWCDVIEKGQAIIQDYDNYKAGKPCPAWITNRTAFETVLGDHWRHIEYQFGWWLNEPPKLQYKFDISRTLLGKLGTPEFPSTPYLTSARFAEICDRAAIEDAKNRFSAKAPNIMDVGAFTFDSKDAEGILFNLFESVTGASPSANWQKSAKMAISTIGVETVLAGFERWISHLDKIDAPTPRHSSQSYLQSAKHSIGSEGKIIGTLPSRGSILYAQAVFRCAYYSIAASHRKIFDMSDTYYASSFESPSSYNPSLSNNNETVACGIAHALSQVPPQKAVPLLGRMLENLLVEEEYCYQRSKKAVTACCASLGEIGTPEAIILLGRVRRQNTDKGQLKQIDKALANAGSKESLSLEDMQDRAMASHSIGKDGRREVEIEGWRVELTVESTRKAKLQTIAPTGKITRGIAKAFIVLPGGKETAKSLTECVEDIERILPEARKRLEGSYRNRRHWPLAFWQEHLAGNGLLHTIVSRLIWSFTNEKGESVTAILRNDQLCRENGNAVALKGTDWTVMLWHPVNETAENVAAWRTFIIREKIRQPFLQAWRPVYGVTDAERHTSTYSNRFAAHVLEQAPAMAVLKAKNWNAVNRVVGGNNEKNERVRLALPAFGLVAEYWVSGVGNMLQAIPSGNRRENHPSTMYAFVATDRLAFYQLETKKHAGGEPITIENIPAMALSEVMLDIDSIVARTSIGNDRHWKDEGKHAKHPAPEMIQLENYRSIYRAGQSAELAATRHAFLAEILPGLEIANCCTLQKDHLLVDGKYHSYKINLTSGGIHIAPNDRYLCIVPKTGSAKETLLPYEDDAILSIIISKAMLLANEDQIEDSSIKSQLGLK